MVLVHCISYADRVVNGYNIHIYRLLSNVRTHPYQCALCVRVTFYSVTNSNQKWIKQYTVAHDQSTAHKYRRSRSRTPQCHNTNNNTMMNTRKIKRKNTWNPEKITVHDFFFRFVAQFSPLQTHTIKSKKKGNVIFERCPIAFILSYFILPFLKLTLIRDDKM